jgi:2-oxoglutarate dehydrogenase complex dehydrogenase (E1) component-like enzyme
MLVLSRKHGDPFHTVARRPSASPATGSHAAHAWEQRDLLSRAFSHLAANLVEDSAVV